MPEITFAGVIAVLTVSVGIVAKLIGHPDQILENHRRKSTEGLSTKMIVIAVVGYSLWTIHGILQGDWVLIVGQGLGVVTSGTILTQIVVYRESN